jgi:VWFA-related protein
VFSWIVLLPDNSSNRRHHQRTTMPSFPRKTLKTLIFVALFAFVAGSAIHAQQAATPDDVIRIKTELVQTEVMVFDKQGHFVTGLRPDQFQLTLNGGRQQVSFFEQIASGSLAEASQLAAARTPAGKPNDKKRIEPARMADNGRVIFFFVDDLHLGTASLNRARKLLQGFVDNQMNPNDQVAVVSTSGQVGFLQQLTDNPTVLKAAVSRLHYKQNLEANTGKTQISDYMASQILDNGNRELYAYLLESIKLEQQMGPGSRHGDHQLAASYSAAPYLRNRLRQINAQSRLTTTDTLAVLESLMASSAGLPGRKLVFFLSDGFVVNERKSGALESLHRLTNAATRVGAVVYTMDLRGVFSNLGSGMDASSNGYADASARRAGVAIGEMTATQEPLKLIADETGGRAIVNTNAFSDAILAAIRETADYYLLAWRPDSTEARDAKFHIEVTVKDRPDLRVRLRNSFYNPAPASTTVVRVVERKESKNGSAEKERPGEAPLMETLGALYPDKQVPVALSVGYLKTGDAELTMKLSMQLDSRGLDFDPDSKAEKSEVDVMGVALDDEGQFGSFKQIVSVPAESITKGVPVMWHQQLRLKPGLYQVRVAVRERRSGRTGSAMQWIELPDTGTTRFGLSSLFLGERKEDVSQGPQQISVDVDHRFARSSALRFQTYVYNPARGAGGPEVSIQTRVFQNRREVMSVNNGKVPVTTEASRLPYWSEIGLAGLTPGRYVLQVTATDQLGNQSAAQRVNFLVE